MESGANHWSPNKRPNTKYPVNDFVRHLDQGTDTKISQWLTRSLTQVSQATLPQQIQTLRWHHQVWVSRSESK